MFYSKKGHITDFHCDFQENISIQLVGSKTWHFQTSQLNYPLRGVTPHFDAVDNSSLPEQQLKVARLCDPSFDNTSIPRALNKEYSVTVYPGDVLYHPAGIWHRVECGEDSISMNMSLTVATYADLVCSALHQLLSKHEDFRRGVRTSYNASNSSTDTLHRMQAAISSIPGIIDDLKAEDILPATCFQHPSFEGKEEVDGASDNSGDTVEDAPGEVLLCYDSFNVDSSEEDTIHKHKYRLNPLAEMLWEEDLQSLGWTAPPNVLARRAQGLALELCVVHGGYGNETFESAFRTVCLVPRAIQKVIQHVVAAYRSSTGQLLSSSRAPRPCFSVGDIAAIMADKSEAPSRKRKAPPVDGLPDACTLVSFMLAAGVLTELSST